MADAYLNLANVYSELHNYLQAITHYKKALDLNPNLERARRGLEKAAVRLDARKQELSPFGRLVDTKQAAAEDTSAAPARQQSPRSSACSLSLGSRSLISSPLWPRGATTRHG